VLKTNRAAVTQKVAWLFHHMLSFDSGPSVRRQGDASVDILNILPAESILDQ
jgi:hypothetical protein